jgi:hypothetical protein
MGIPIEVYACHLPAWVTFFLLLTLPVVFPDGRENIHNMACRQGLRAMVCMGWTRLDDLFFTPYGHFKGSPDNGRDLFMEMAVFGQERTGVYIPERHGHMFPMVHSGMETGNHQPFRQVGNMNEGHCFITSFLTRDLLYHERAR